MADDKGRYLVVRGKATAVRLALPAMGTVTIGHGPENDWRVDEPGMAAEHVALFLEKGVGIEALAPDTAWLDPSGGEKPLTPKKSVDLPEWAWVRAGGIELAVGVTQPASRFDRAWCRSYLERRIAEAIAAGHASTTAVVRLTAPGPEVELILLARKKPNDLLGDLGEGEWAMVLFGATEPEAQAMMANHARDLDARGITVEIGVVLAQETEAKNLLALAAERTARQSPSSSGSRLYRSTHPAMERLQRLVEQVGPSEAHVLIVGETGAGKEVVAQQIHQLSSRSARPLIRMNAGDLGDSFLESPRAFFARAAGATVLLDEVAGLSPRAQLALGDLVEDSSAPAHGVRFIATSNQDLAGLVAEGSFRKDLYFRLNRVTLNLPPLRERVSDIAPLVQLFLESGGRTAPKISLAVKERLESHTWPGNVRELRSVIERALLAAGPDGPLNLEHLPPELLEADDAPPPPMIEQTAPGGPIEAARGSLREEMLALEKRRILEALEKYPTQTEAAKALDIPLRTFLNRLDALGIPRARKKD